MRHTLINFLGKAPRTAGRLGATLLPSEGRASRPVLTILWAFTFLVGAVSGTYALAESSSSCPVPGIKSRHQYCTKDERSCFRTAKAAEKAGFIAFNATTKHRRRVHSSDNGSRCAFVGVKALGSYFSQGELTCFSSIHKAEHKGYVHLVVPTPGPSATPTSTPSATPTIGATGNDISFSFGLYPSELGGNYTGHCDGILNAAQTNFSLTCTHDVPNPWEVHLHLLDNSKVCTLPAPPSPFHMECPLTPDQAALIAVGKAVVSVHVFKGREGQALAGLLIPAP